MAVRGPTPQQMRTIAEDLGMSVSDEDVNFFIEQMAGNVTAYQMIDALPDYLPEVKYPRSTGYRPAPEENPYNAWYWRTSVKGKSRGPLAHACIANLIPIVRGSQKPIVIVVERRINSFI